MTRVGDGLAASRVRSRWMTGSGALRTGPTSAAVAAAALPATRRPTPRLFRRHRPGRGGHSARRRRALSRDRRAGRRPAVCGGRGFVLRSRWAGLTGCGRGTRSWSLTEPWSRRPTPGSSPSTCGSQRESWAAAGGCADVRKRRRCPLRWYARSRLQGGSWGHATRPSGRGEGLVGGGDTPGLVDEPGTGAGR